MSDPLVPVSVACPCPGTPHADGDTVFLAPHISLAGGMLAEALMVRVWTSLDPRTNDGSTMASLTFEAELREVYLLDGVKEWTFVNDDGPILVNEWAIRDELLTNFTLARPVGDKADSLYSRSVLDPLRARLSKSLRSLRLPALTSTSANSSSSAKRPRRSKPSSTASTGRERASA